MAQTEDMRQSGYVGWEAADEGSDVALEDGHVAANSDYSEDSNDEKEEEDEYDGSELVSARQEKTPIDPRKLAEMLDKIDYMLGDEDFVNQLERSPDAQANFLGTYRKYIAEKPPTDQDNVLHSMAGKRRTSTWLLNFMLANYKERMEDLDNARRPALIVAIVLKKEEFITTVLDSGYDDAGLERILGLVTSDRGNGIHSAIKQCLNPNLTIRLINKVSDKVLKTPDMAGCTPLHCAVEYDRCTASQLGVVMALMERDDAALDVKKGTLSVYRYHFSTRPKEETTTVARTDKVLSTKSRVSHASQQASHESTDKAMEKGEQKAIEKGEQKAVEKGEQKAIEKGEQKAVEKGKGGKDAEVKAPAQTQTEDLRTIMPLRRASTIRKTSVRQHVTVAATNSTSANNQANESRKITSAPKTQTKRKGGTRSNVAKANSSFPGVEKRFADEIAKEIKLQYLRSMFKSRKDKTTEKERDYHAAIDFLYGDNQSKHIYLNLLEREEFISERALKKGSYSRFDFDEALQFVAVRRLIFSKQTESAVPQRGRSDMVTLFKWLHDKGVKNIIKVIVQDDQEPSHSDEAIIKSLSLFAVEILDWSKSDLCPQMIQEACWNVRELYLSWSGLNGMLLAWSDIDGLAKLPNLTHIYLHQTRFLESEIETEKKLQRFETRLEESKAKRRTEKPALPLTVHRPKPVESKKQSTESAGQEQKKDDIFKDHQWLEIMDKFAAGIFSLPPDKYLGLPNLPDTLKKDVRICLIDDGVDTEHKSITDCMDGGRAFGVYQDSHYSGMTRPYYNSSTNHGTLMANMIARVCPYAKIFSYRLDTREGAEADSIHFTAKSAADALTDAASRDFDIISMSWTVKLESAGDENNATEISRLDDALEKAAKSKLVFCSAPDTGNISPQELWSYYPVGSTKTNKIFKIGAAKADNTPWGKAGSRNIIDFMLPGHEVREKKDHEVSQANKSLKSGSSIATALAAGLAGLIIHIVRMAAIHAYVTGKENESNAITPASLTSIKSYATMHKTFSDMAEKQHGDDYVHVGKKFASTGHQLEPPNDNEDEDDEVEDKRWKVMAKMARDLVSSTD